MACQLFQWLIAGEGPSTLQHALVGIGCLLAYDALGRWRKRHHDLRISDSGTATTEQIQSSLDREEQRRAA
ncbi:MAG TPA: hypothetical protein VGI75_16610 [Pirellulales bacterium]